MHLRDITPSDYSAENLAAAFEVNSAPVTYPLSFAQQRLWDLEKSSDNHAQRHVHTNVRLRGELHLATLQRAVNIIVARHDSLRTCFGEVDGSPRQWVRPKLEIDIPVEDLSECPNLSRDAALAGSRQKEWDQVFDLANGPLLAMSLVKIDAQGYLLLVSLHHLVADCWSMGVFNRELRLAYEALRTNKPVRFAPLHLQYPEFAREQEALLSPSERQRLSDYWHEQLEGASSITITADHPRPKNLSRAAKNHAFKLTPTLSAQLRTFGQLSRVTPFISLLSAFHVLLARHSGQTDILTGSPVANRPEEELEDIIGLFLTPLVIRTNLAEPANFREFVDRVRNTFLDAQENQELPVHTLASEWDPSRDFDQKPIYQLAFVLQSAPEGSNRMGDLDAETFEPPPQTTDLDLTLEMKTTGDAWDGLFCYRAELFASATIARLADDFLVLLERLLTAPDLPIPLSGAIEDLNLADPARPPESDPSSNDSADARDGPRTRLELDLAMLWAEILDRPRVGRDEDFFALGGDSLLAVRISSGLLHRTGQKVPIAVFFTAPTVATMAAWLESAPDAPLSKSLIPLQHQGRLPALFCIHGWGGNAYIYLHLAKVFTSDRPLVGLQGVGLDGRSPRHTSVEEMAAHYVAEIRAYQPEGPYHLIGFSAGGWMAYAVAQEFRRQGAQVGRLFLLDTGADARLPYMVNAWHTTNQFIRHVSSVWKNPSHYLDRPAARAAWGIPHLYGRIRYYLTRFSRPTIDLPVETEVGLAPPPIRLARQNPHEPPEYFHTAITRYTISPYEGDVVSICAETDHSLRGQFWPKIVRGKVDAVQVQGTHLEILKPENVHLLADILHRFLSTDD